MVEFDFVWKSGEKKFKTRNPSAKKKSETTWAKVFPGNNFKSIFSEYFFLFFNYSQNRGERKS